MTFPFRRAERCLLVAAAFATTIPAMSQFEMQDSRTIASLRGIASPGNGVAWASGTGGTVLRTEDGGIVWQGCAIPLGAEKLDFRGVQAFDAQTALVMSSGKGDLSRVYKTTDGCRTWKLVFTNPDGDGFFDAMQFRDRKSGVILGDPVAEPTAGWQRTDATKRSRFAWFDTANGGDSWIARSTQQPLLGSYGQEGAFAASNSSLLLATPKPVENFSVFVTGNPGRALYVYAGKFAQTTPHPLPAGQWSVGYVDLPLTSGATAGGFSVAQNGNAFVVVGGDYSQPNNNTAAAAFGMLGGKLTTADAQPHGYRSSVAYDAPSKTWITVGPNGTDVSRDDGRNWVPLRPSAGDAADADTQWNALALPFAVGPHGRIGRLREGVLQPASR